MGFLDAVAVCFRKYFDFSGRGSRPEYWWFTLFVVAGSVATTVLDGILFGFDAGLTDIARTPFGSVFTLATLIPSVSATARRLHDMGRSGWAMLLSGIPLTAVAVLGILYLEDESLFYDASGESLSSGMLAASLLAAGATIVTLAVTIWWLTRPSDLGPNRFGPEPA